MRYLAIDFETANSSRSSICAFGYALFSNGNLIESGERLCKPYPNYYDPRNTSIHGLSENDTNDKPGFETILPRITEMNLDFLVAHNAAFDMSCIRYWCDYSRVPYPVFVYLCSLVTSRVVNPGCFGYSLPSLCSIYGIGLDHHKAESDAIASGSLLSKQMHQLGVASMDQFCRLLNIRPGVMYPDSYCPCGICNNRHNSRITNNDPLCECQISPVLDGRFVCFTGALTRCSRNEAEKIVQAASGIPQGSVNAKTNYLVVGISDYIDFDCGKTTTKLLKAEDYIRAGKDIQIISEDEFWDLLKV